MNNKTYVSPLRYPGGKAKLTGYIRQIIYENNLRGGVYIEPYVGGASVALGLLLSGDVDEIVINDKDKSIYAFWYSVINQSKDLCHMIRETEITVKEWERQKAVQSKKDNCSLLELGFSTFFLNRTNRSGILKGGIIGGRKQQGNYKIDARFNKEDLIQRIENIAEKKDSITLCNQDALDFLSYVKAKFKENSIIYLDPPYYVKGHGLYMNFYKDDDHRNIAEQIKSLTDLKWLMSYDNVDFINALYENYRKITFELNYSANNTGKGEEVMIFSNEIIIPNCNIV